MAKAPNGSDLAFLLRGLGRLGSAAIEIHSKEINKAWSNSSLKPLAEKSIPSIHQIINSPAKLSQIDVSGNLSETFNRISTVVESIKAYVSIDKSQNGIKDFPSEDASFSELNLGEFLGPHGDISSTETSFSNGQTKYESFGKLRGGSEATCEDVNSVPHIESLPLHHFEKVTDVTHEIRTKILKFDSLISNAETSRGEVTADQIDAIERKLVELQGHEFAEDLKSLGEGLKINCAPEIQETGVNYTKFSNSSLNEEVIENTDRLHTESIHATKHLENEVAGSNLALKIPKLIGRKPLAKSKVKSTLSNESQARKVPQSRFSRLATFGGLAAGLGMGTLAEMTRRTLGINSNQKGGALLDSSAFLTEANAKRIVDTLCKVRGAALKLGQMLSIQDASLINPELQKIFERVRQSADFMPTWQLERTLVKDLGTEWRSLVASFDDQPFAAASIGQVHQATLHDGRSVAMKIQYPGVAEGIESDINNLVSTLNVANILPEGLFVDNVIEVAKRELRWECDYEREKKCTKRFRELLTDHTEYYVPEVIDELCTKQVFTTELIEGISVDKCVSLNQETRNYISSLILKLCLMEVFEFGFMQTDPNWSNFFYNQDTNQLALLDFGACREYKKEFVDKYIHIIHGAAVQDREKVSEYSKQLGFLTGYEAKIMIDAHVDAVMILGEAFQYDKPFSFGSQNTTRRIQQLVPVMLSHRMCAPPEESYSLHRKMSGAFLLCAKLDASINCKPFFDHLWNRYNSGGIDNTCTKLPLHVT